MMELLRQNMKKIMWAIALMFIGGIFFWYGSGSRLKDTVAEVGSSKIKVRGYQKRVTQQLRRERDKSEEDLTDNQIFEMKRNVLGSMINQELRYQEAQRLGIIVTDEEIMSTIQNLPQFQQDEKFNFKLYFQTLKYSLNASPEEFEKMLKKEIAIRKLERLILSSAKVTTAELKLRYLDKEGSLEGFEKKRDELKNEILQEKRTAIYTNWVRNLQQNTNIKVSPELAGLASPGK
jgi:parvulin-like peptidyl-prolyl isomerase